MYDFTNLSQHMFHTVFGIINFIFNFWEVSVMKVVREECHDILIWGECHGRLSGGECHAPPLFTLSSGPLFWSDPVGARWLRGWRPSACRAPRTVSRGEQQKCVIHDSITDLWVVPEISSIITWIKHQHISDSESHRNSKSPSGGTITCNEYQHSSSRYTWNGFTHSFCGYTCHEYTIYSLFIL